MSNKRNTPLTTAAFYAVMLFALAGVAAGSYLLIVPEGNTPAKTVADTPVTAVTPDTDQPPAEVLNPIPLQDPDIPEEPPAEEPPEEEPVLEEPPAEMPEIPVSAPVSSAPVKITEPTPVVSPLDGEVLTVFAMDSLIYSETLGDWRTHDGIDITAPAGTPVLAACSGVVADVRDDDLLGTTVVLQHSAGFVQNLRADQKVQGGHIPGAKQPADKGHKHVVYQRGGDLAEGCGDDDTDRHIDHVAAGDKFTEFFYKLFHNNFLLSVYIISGNKSGEIQTND